jgi:hypothetical protein
MTDLNLVDRVFVCDTDIEVIGSGPCSPSYEGLLSVADMVAEAEANMPDYGPDWRTYNSQNLVSGYSNFYALSELVPRGEYPYEWGVGVNTASDCQYQFFFQPPKVGNGRKYTIFWEEQFTPHAYPYGSGGDPSYVSKCLSWDGVVPADYNPLDQDTWPRFSPEEMNHSTTDNGLTFIGYRDQDCVFHRHKVRVVCTGDCTGLTSLCDE